MRNAQAPGSWHDFRNSLRCVPWQEAQGSPGAKAELFSATSLESAELEYLDVLHALVVATKPMRVLETGTNLGVSAAAAAYGLKHNAERGAEAGVLHTIEHRPALAAEAQKTVTALGLVPFVKFSIGDSIDVIRHSGWRDPFELVFFDSTRRSRSEEFLSLKKQGLLAPGAFLLFHDTSPLRVGNAPDDGLVQAAFVESVERIARECSGVLRLGLSRGLTICQA